MVGLRVAAAVVFGSVLFAVPGDADACMNEVQRNLGPTEEIAQAEYELGMNEFGEAMHRVRVRYPKIRELGSSAPPLARRALRIYALALVRAEGQMDLSLGWAPWGNLEWAIETLADLDSVRPNDPESQADLAEARIALTRTRAEGVRVLEELDRKDLLGSALAYRALARARRAAGDDKGVAAAVARCEKMALTPSQCTGALVVARTPKPTYAPRGIK